MPPHCDSLDAHTVALVLPFVPKTGETEVIEAFEKVAQARLANAVSREVADRYLFETVVRVHRAGEGAPFTGLKPAGLDVGPVIPVAEKAIESDNPTALEQLLVGAVRTQVIERFHHLRHLRETASRDVEGAREYVEATLGLQVWAHGLYGAAKATGHAAAHAHEAVARPAA